MRCYFSREQGHQWTQPTATVSVLPELDSGLVVIKPRAADTADKPDCSATLTGGGEFVEHIPKGTVKKRVQDWETKILKTGTDDEERLHQDYPNLEIEVLQD